MAGKPRLLVPLDGSPLAEGALAEAATLARALNAEVLLLQVIAPAADVIRSGTMTISVDEVWAAEREEALRYLNRIRARPEWAGITMTSLVELGTAADMILDVARARQVDRIVMTTHGRTGVTRWVFGSVAEKVLRAAECTVVLVRSEATLT